LKREG
jgi:PAS domain S-box-containing protein